MYIRFYSVCPECQLNFRREAPAFLSDGGAGTGLFAAAVGMGRAKKVPDGLGLQSKREPELVREIFALVICNSIYCRI